MERITRFEPAFDRITQGAGIHGVDLWMILKGEHGAVTFCTFTNWHLSHITKRFRKDLSPEKYYMFEPSPADVSTHSKTPMYDGQPPRESCPYIDGAGLCYCDGSSLHANKVYDILLENGSDGVWNYLENLYLDQFGELK